MKPEKAELVYMDNKGQRKQVKPASQRPECDEFWDTRFKSGIVPWDAGNNGRGGVQQALVDFAQRFAEHWPHNTAPRVLIPGCGSAYEVVLLNSLGWQVTALDFSAEAIVAARRIVGEQWSGSLRQADFFEFADDYGFDVVYERAFLCALPRKLWLDYGRKMRELVAPGGLLAGFFYFSDDLIGPPFGATQQQINDLFDADFICLEDLLAADSVAMFAEREHWMIWQRLVG